VFQTIGAALGRWRPSPESIQDLRTALEGIAAAARTLPPA
jgi:hypothetical protein